MTNVTNSAKAEQLLGALARFSTQQFKSEQEMVTSILNTIADVIEVRTPFLASTLGGIFEILDTVNRKGCRLEAGAILPLPDSY